MKPLFCFSGFKEFCGKYFLVNVPPVVADFDFERYFGRVCNFLVYKIIDSFSVRSYCLVSGASRKRNNSY